MSSKMSTLAAQLASRCREREGLAGESDRGMPGNLVAGRRLRVARELVPLDRGLGDLDSVPGDFWMANDGGECRTVQHPEVDGGWSASDVFEVDEYEAALWADHEVAVVEVTMEKDAVAWWCRYRIDEPTAEPLARLPSRLVPACEALQADVDLSELIGC